MRLKALDCSQYGLKAFAPLVPSSISRSSKCELNRTISLIVLSNPFLSKTLLKSQSPDKTSRIHAVRRSCKSNMDGTYGHDYDRSFHVKGSAKSSGEEGSNKNVDRRKKKLHCATSHKSPFLDKHERSRDSFLDTRFDFLEPMMLGIKPEFPDWPDQETVVWATIEQKAKSLDIPLSLRMIKKKLQSKEGLFTDSKDSASYCSVKAAFASMVFIVVELQSYALQMREALCSEDLEVITSKVQNEMHSSFVWLFQQVFSRTPTLMLHVMMLLADFSVYSASHNMAAVKGMPLSQTNVGSTSLIASPELTRTQIGGFQQSKQDMSLFSSGNQLEDVVELKLWNSMVDDAEKLREGIEDEVLDRDTMLYFVSPVTVEIEPDNYEDYLRTDLLYQMNLSFEPTNSLLLCNYAQFLHLVAKDYDRAEECFKRAVQITPPDAEALSRYANFLWTIRSDFSGAEERFLQALAAEPENSYYASKYANFLWSTGGDETCFPLNMQEL